MQSLCYQKLLNICCLIIFSFSQCYGQFPLLWEEIYEASQANRHVGNCSARSEDGGFVIGATAELLKAFSRADDYYNNRFKLIKVGPSGQKEWEHVYGIVENRTSYLRQVIPTHDGGYVLAGTKWVDDVPCLDPDVYCTSDWDYRVMKVDHEGNIIWNRLFGGDSNDQLVDIIEIEEKGYLLAGSSNSSISGNKSEASRGAQDYWLVMIDYSGELIWDKTIGGNAIDALVSLKKNQQQLFILGHSSSDISGDKYSSKKSQTDCWLLSLDYDGNILWDKSYGNYSFGSLYDLAVLSNNSLLISCRPSFDDAELLLLDQNVENPSKHP